MSPASLLLAQMSACTKANRFATPTPTRSAHLALRSRFKSGNRSFAASSATTSAREFASMWWWKAILFCLMTDGPASSNCDLTLIKSVTPLLSSINWKRIDHKSPLGPCTRSPCVQCTSSRISRPSDFGCSTSHRLCREFG